MAAWQSSPGLLRHSSPQLNNFLNTCTLSATCACSLLYTSGDGAIGLGASVALSPAVLSSAGQAVARMWQFVS